MKGKKNKKQLILSLAIIAVLFVASIGIFAYPMLRDGKMNFLHTEADEKETELKDYKIYWNVDGKEYMQASSNGITTREMKDGCFSVKFSIDGKEVLYKVMNMRLMNEIDGSQIMGLSINENGFIEEMIPLEDMGATIVGEQFYVAELGDKKIRLDSSSGYDGVSTELQRKEGMQVFDVSEYADTVGASTELIEGDRVLAIANADDEITHVYTTQRSEIFGSEQMLCEHCQEKVYFRKWKFTNRLPNVEGHYQLDTDVKVSRQTNISADNTVVLDLNGHTATAPETSRVYATYEERSGLVIMDKSKEQTGTIKVSGKVPSGGCVWVRYGTFSMYGGTLDACDAKDTKGMGLALKTEKYTEAYIYGGTIYGGKTTCNLKDDMNGTTGGIGGAVHIGGMLTMNGGTIKNGVAKAYFVKNKNSYSGGKGGNVAVAASGEFTMNGGEIIEGRSEAGGGNIFLYTGAVFNMNGGSVYGGKNINLGKNGGNVWVNAGSTMNMSGGVIEKGVVEGLGGNMALYGTLNMSGGTIQDGRIVRDNKFYESGKSHNIYFQKGTLNISGGRVAGYLQVIKNTTTPVELKLSGTAQIDGKKTNLYLPSGVNIDVSDLKEGANIYITALGFFSNETVEGNEQYMFSDYDDTDIVYAEKKLYAGQQHCICGGWHFDAEGNRVDGHYGKCTGELVLWEPWTKTNLLPRENGYWYLTKNVELTVQMNLVKDSEVYVDLNGKKVTQVAKKNALEDGKYGENKRIYSQHLGNTKLVLLDTSETRSGSLVPIGTESLQGNCIWVQGKSTCEIYAGIYDASKVVSKNNGVAISVEKGSALAIYSGTIIGGTSTCHLNNKSETIGGVGGAVHISGTLTMDDGTIKKGKVKAYYVKNKDSYTGGKGGNVAVEASGVFTMNGGKILDGRSEAGGGNLFLYTGAVFNMNGGTISGGKNINLGKNGGNVWINAGSTMNMTGGVIEKGVVEGNGGNMALYGTLNMSGGTIQNGRIVRDNKFYESGKSHNIYFQKGTLNMSGGRIAGYLQVIKNTTTPVELKLSGTAQINGKSVNLHLPTGVNIDVSGLKEGANICVTALGFFSNETDAGNEQYLFSDYEDRDIVYAEKKLYAGHQYCICGGWHFDAEGNRVEGHYGKCTGELVLWKPWTATNELPRESGNWYLTKDIKMTQQMNLVKDSEVYVNLNGKKVTQVAKKDALEDGQYGENRRIYSQHLGNTKLVLLDTSETRSGSLVPIGTESLQGNCIWVNNNSTCEIYAGIYDASNVTAKGKGVAISVENKSTLAIYGGTIKGGTAVKSVKEENGETMIENGRGGALYANGRVDMYDGLITGGKADFTGGNIYVYTNGSFYMHGGVVEYGEANRATVEEHTLANASGGGGNIYAVCGTVEITDGVIRGGSAVNNGGSIYISSEAKLHIMGGQIIGGKTTTNGGNLAVMGSIQMTGGLVAEGSARNARNYNAYCNISNVEAIFDMKGGTIKGGLEIGSANKATLNFGGDMIVFDKEIGPNLYLYDGSYINLTGFKDGAKISITKKGYGNTAGITGLVSTETATESDLNYVFADGTKSTVKLTADNRLTLYNPSVEEVTWTSWPTATSGETMPTESGYYELTKDITLSAQWNVPADAKIVVNLNGKTITGAEGKRVCSLAAGSTLTIQDNSEGAKGKIVMNVNEEQIYGAQGGIMLLNASSTLELKSGTLDASKYHVKNSGAAIYISNDATFKMSGGTVSGGTVYTSDNGTKRYGGSIYLAGKGSSGEKGGTFIMQGGTVAGGTAGSSSDELSGGNIFISSDATFTMSGGILKDGTAYGKGGNIYVGSGSTFAMKAGTNGTGTISGGISKTQGGNVYIATGNEVVMEAGLITAGTAKTHGGNIYLQERTGSASAGYKVTKFIMNGGTISRGATTDKGSAEYGGANVYVPTYAEFCMNEGAVISDGTTAASGGNIHVNGVGAKFVMNNSTITGGVASNYDEVKNGVTTVKSRAGGSISVRNQATFEMSGEKSFISGGTTEKEAGGNIAVFRGNLNITGGTVKDGISSNATKHGNIFVNNTKKDDSDDSQYSITIKGCIFALKDDAVNKGVNLKTVYNTEQDCDY